MIRILVNLLGALAMTGLLAAQDTTPAKPAEKAKTEAAKFVSTDGYPFDTCIVSDEPLDDSAKVFTIEGYTFKACCKKCQGKVQKDPKPYIAKLEEGVKAAQAANYPLANCPVSGKPLTDKAVSMVVNNTLVKLCCPNCQEKASKDATAIVAKVQGAAFEKANAAYAAKTCPVSGHELDDKAVAVMHGNNLVKLCCEDCNAKLKAAPNAMAAKVAPKAEVKKDAKADAKPPAAPAHGKEMPMAAAVGADPACEAGAANGAGCCQAGKAEAKTECCEGEAKATADVKAAPVPAANPAAAPKQVAAPKQGATASGDGCCEAGKAEAKSECCEGEAAATGDVKAAPAKKPAAAPKQTTATTTDTACESGAASGAGCCQAGAAPAKTGCCGGAAKAAEVKAEAKPAANKLN